jgi:hypothetical protein
LPSAFPDGVWYGELDLFPTRDDEKVRSPYKIKVAACSGVARIWYHNDDDGTYETTEDEFRVQSQAGSHIVSILHAESSDPPGWVEAQALLLIEMPGDKLKVQWSRAVHNPQRPVDHKWRTFLEGGIGVLSRDSRKCVREQVFPNGHAP